MNNDVISGMTSFCLLFRTDTGRTSRENHSVILGRDKAGSLSPWDENNDIVQNTSTSYLYSSYVDKSS